MNQIFSHILEEKASIEQHRQKFTKNFQIQLAYMELKIKQDADRASYFCSCCFSCMKWCSRIKDQSEQIQDQQKKLNRRFYSIFQKMSSNSKQHYFLQLLQMIGSLVVRFEKKRKKYSNKQPNLKLLRQQLIDQDLQAHINQQNRKDLEEIQKSTFYAKTIIDGMAADKIVRLDGRILQLIQHVDKNQTIIKVDPRNYIFLQKSKNNQHNFSLQIVFEGVIPKSINFQLISDVKSLQLIQFLKLTAKIGKIERLVNNFDLQTIVYGSRSQMNKQRKGVLQKELMRSSEEFVQQIEEQQMFRSITSPKKQSRLLARKKFEQIHYNQMKAKLIQVLNHLAEKKKAENQKIKAFIHKELDIHKQTKSKALCEAANCQEAKIFTTKSRELLEPEKLEPNYDENINQAVLRIVGMNHHISCKNIQERSLKSQSERQSPTIQKHVSYKQLSFHFSPNIYKTMYPKHPLNIFNTLIDFSEIEINQNIWKEPKQKYIKKSLKMSLQNKVCVEKVRAYQHKSLKNKFKIIINVSTDIKFLVQALSNIEAWSKWHPNIQNINIFQTIQSENSVELGIDCKGSCISFESSLKVHLFKIQNKYFISIKSIQSQIKKKDKSLLNYLGFGNSIPRTYDYLLLMLQNYGSQGNNSQIVVDVQLNPYELSKHPSIKQEQLTFFINFCYISNFWKIQSQTEDYFQEDQLEPKAQKKLFDCKWTVSSQDCIQNPWQQI